MTADKGKIFWKCCNWCINKLVLRNKPWCDPTHLHSVVSWIHDDQRWSLHRSAPHRSRDTEVQLMLLPQLWTSLSLCPCTHYHVPNNQKCGSLSLLYKIIIFIFPKVSQLWKLFGDQTMNQVIMCLTIMYARTRARSILLFPSSSGVDRCRPKSTKI